MYSSKQYIVHRILKKACVEQLSFISYQNEFDDDYIFAQMNLAEDMKSVLQHQPTVTMKKIPMLEQKFVDNERIFVENVGNCVTKVVGDDSHAQSKDYKEKCILLYGKGDYIMVEKDIAVNATKALTHKFEVNLNVTPSLQKKLPPKQDRSSLNTMYDVSRAVGSHATPLKKEQPSNQYRNCPSTSSNVTPAADSSAVRQQRPLSMRRRRSRGTSNDLILVRNPARERIEELKRLCWEVSVYQVSAAFGNLSLINDSAAKNIRPKKRKRRTCH